MNVGEGAPAPGPVIWFFVDAIRRLVSRQAKFEIVVTLKYGRESGRRRQVRHQMALPIHDPKAVRPCCEDALQKISDLMLEHGGRHTPYARA